MPPAGRPCHSGGSSIRTSQTASACRAAATSSGPVGAKRPSSSVLGLVALVGLPRRPHRGADGYADANAHGEIVYRRADAGADRYANGDPHGHARSHAHDRLLREFVLWPTHAGTGPFPKN